MTSRLLYPVWCWHCNQIVDSQDVVNCPNCGKEFSGVLRVKNWKLEGNESLKQKTFDELFLELCSRIGYNPKVAREYFEKDLYIDYFGNNTARETFERINNGWEKLVNNKDPQVRIAMTYLGQLLNKAAVLALARDPSAEVRINLIRNQCLCKEAVEILVNDKSPEIIEELRSTAWGLPGRYAFVEKGFLINQVVRHPDTPSWAIERIIKEFHDYSFVSEIRNIPWHQNLPSNIFTEATTKTAWGRFFIKQFLSAYGYESTKRISAEMIEQRKNFILMRLSKSNSVSEARDLLDRLLVELDLDQHPEFAQHPLLSEIHIERLSRHPSKKIREEIALRPDTPAEILTILATDTESTVVRRVLENSNTPSEILSDKTFLKLANNRAFIARNPSIPIEIAELLLTKGEARVIENLAKNSGIPSEVVTKFYEATSDELKFLWAYSLNASTFLLDEIFQNNLPLTEKTADILCANPNFSEELRKQIISKCSKQMILDLIAKSELNPRELESFVSLEFPEEVRNAALDSLIILDDPSIKDMPFSQMEKRLWIRDSFPRNLLESNSKSVRTYILEHTFNIEELYFFSTSTDKNIRDSAVEKLSMFCAPHWMFGEAIKKEARLYTFDTGINWL